MQRFASVFDQMNRNGCVICHCDFVGNFSRADQRHRQRPSSQRIDDQRRICIHLNPALTQIRMKE